MTKEYLAMPSPLADRIALVTGASRGIGHAVSLALARAGAHVVAVARTVGGLEELDDEVRKLGGSATLVPLDMTDYDGIARLAAALNERYRRLDVLIGNAGIGGPSSPLGHVEPKAWDDVIAVNVTANWHVIRHFEPLLRASDAGRAVFISSGSAHNARAYRGPYNVSKAALETLARTFASETASTSIRVNIFNPGPTRTRMRAAIMPGEDPMSLPPVEEVADKIVALTLTSVTETGKLYDFPTSRMITYRLPTAS
jgi:NAD(P)-dependent dehydrogenase (short-subunit alcohol dehydrogenase family)